MHIDPASDVVWKADGRWVVISGHTNDTRGDACHFVVSSETSDDEARRDCRRAFVVTSVRKASAALQVNSFARIVIPELNVRAAPSTSAPVLAMGDAYVTPTDLHYGTTSGVDDVYVVDGPVTADGYRWWQVLPIEYVSDQANGKPTTLGLIPNTDFTGWVADGEGRQAWVIPVESPCPDPPVEIAEMTPKFASWAIGLACFANQILSFRGWNDGSEAIFSVKPTGDDDTDDSNRLDFRVYPATLTLPQAGQWFRITGQYDHPSAATCAEDILRCRAMFTATEIVGLGP